MFWTAEVSHIDLFSSCKGCEEGMGETITK